jgi:hypothetical protein
MLWLPLRVLFTSSGPSALPKRNVPSVQSVEAEVAEGVATVEDTIVTVEGALPALPALPKRGITSMGSGDEEVADIVATVEGALKRGIPSVGSVEEEVAEVVATVESTVAEVEATVAGAI